MPGRKGENTDASKKFMRELMVHRMVLGLSLQDVAAAIGVDRSVIFRWEQGTSGAIFNSAIRYAEALGLEFTLVPKQALDKE